MNSLVEKDLYFNVSFVTSCVLIKIRNGDTRKHVKSTPKNMEIKVEPVPDQPSSSNIGTQIVNNYYLNNSTLNNDNSTVNNSIVNNSTVNNSIVNNNLTMNNNMNITYTSFGRENLDHLTSQ